MATQRQPRRTDLDNPPAGFEWVSCNVRDYGSAGLRVHLIRTSTRKEHWQTTVCGSTASAPGIWRRVSWNSTKAKCLTCATRCPHCGFEEADYCDCCYECGARDDVPCTCPPNPRSKP